ncbi:GTP pyrophosphokinase [Microbacterium sp. JZ31]|uniref:GTP pyrophosphokinase n=1 Tax=Microbacterium sp. JZ31 TaxID=1906274 RepID=UPI00193132F5|nr:GTP pyrophosphokinase family protein [Microbacterium sp. JZ31]
MTSQPIDGDFLEDVRDLRDRLSRFLADYRFGMREIETKLSILRDDFEHAHAYNPVEHISCRLKSPDSIAEKVVRKGIEPDLATIRREITDIAGVRVTCSFVRDVYRLFDLLVGQDDITLREVKDYIATPKANGYKSLHAIVEVPVFLAQGMVRVPVEVQLRTIAMDFWASLEHKIYYKYDKHVPARLTDTLREAALTAAELDARMESLHREIHGDPVRPEPVPPLWALPPGGGLSHA